LLGEPLKALAERVGENFRRLFGAVSEARGANRKAETRSPKEARNPKPE
jgi:hypothetical protein